MYKTKDQQKSQAIENFKGGKGPFHVTHIVDKEDLRSDCRLFVKATLQPGSSLGYHPHNDEEEVYYILSGQGVVNNNGEIRTVYPGDTVITGYGNSHSIENQGTEPLEFLAVVLGY